MHPYLAGRISLDGEWSLELPFVCQQRFEDDQMVLWRPGFTIWLSIWGNDTGEPANSRMSKIAAAASKGKTNEKSTSEDGFSYYHYRIDEPSDDDRVAAFQGFAFGLNSLSSLPIETTTGSPSQDATLIPKSTFFISGKVSSFHLDSAQRGERRC